MYCDPLAAVDIDVVEETILTRGHIQPSTQYIIQQAISLYDWLIANEERLQLETKYLTHSQSNRDGVQLQPIRPKARTNTER
jgi:replication initiation and membrane attachment protein DnaB